MFPPRRRRRSFSFSNTTLNHTCIHHLHLHLSPSSPEPPPLSSPLRYRNANFSPPSLFTSFFLNYFYHMDASKEGRGLSVSTNQHDYWLIYPQTFLPPSLFLPPSSLFLPSLHPFYHQRPVTALLPLFSLLFPKLNFIVSSPTPLSS